MSVLISERERCFPLLLPAIHRLWSIGTIKVQVKYNILSRLKSTNLYSRSVKEYEYVKSLS